MQSPQAQAQPQAPHSFHHATTPLLREEVPREAIPEHRRESRVQLLAASHGDAGQDLVPESTSESETTPRGRDREVSTVGETAVAAVVRVVRERGTGFGARQRATVLRRGNGGGGSKEPAELLDVRPCGDDGLHAASVSDVVEMRPRED